MNSRLMRAALLSLLCAPLGAWCADAPALSIERVATPLGAGLSVRSLGKEVGLAPFAFCQGPCAGPPESAGRAHLSESQRIARVEQETREGEIINAWRSSWMLDPATGLLRLIRMERIEANQAGPIGKVSIDWERGERIAQGPQGTSRCAIPTQAPPPFEALSERNLRLRLFEPACAKAPIRP